MEMNEYLCMFRNSTRTILCNQNDQTIPARILCTGSLLPYFPLTQPTPTLYTPEESCVLPGRLNDVAYKAERSVKLNYVNFKAINVLDNPKFIFLRYFLSLFLSAYLFRLYFYNYDMLINLTTQLNLWHLKAERGLL
jgi:hypothetical protein